MKPRTLKILFCLAFLLISRVWSSDFQPITVILIRHAEKSTEPAEDPVLSDAGKERVRGLVRLLELTGIDAIYTSQYARTRLTGEPLAEHLGISITQIDAAKTDALVTELLTHGSGRTALVVGHSNTLPEIMHALGAGEIAEIPESEYDNLSLVTVYAPGKATLLHLKY